MRQRKLIVEWIGATCLGEYWMVDLLRHMASRGEAGDEALAALSRFVAEAIERRGPPATLISKGD
jgi:hypothetical protein